MVKVADVTVLSVMPLLNATARTVALAVIWNGAV